MGFSISEISPNIILGDGGREIIVTGVFESGHRYHIHLGDAMDETDPICYSGKPGQGNDLYPINGVRLRGYTVRTIITGSYPFSVFVMDVDTGEAHILDDALVVQKPQFYTSVYTLRKLCPIDWLIGPRNITLEERVE